MRSSEPAPADPWPDDMLIRISTPGHLLTLLYIHEVWDLAVLPSMPALDPVPPRGTSALPDSAPLSEWTVRWFRAWERGWDWYDIHDPSIEVTREMLRGADQPGRPLDPVLPPFWETEYGSDGIDRDAMSAWSADVEPRHGRPLAETPERMSLPALADAWRGGLTTILLLPYSGYYADRVSESHLAVSVATHEDPASFTRALRTPV